jgi:hypothetical protein
MEHTLMRSKIVDGKSSMFDLLIPTTSALVHDSENFMRSPIHITSLLLILQALPTFSRRHENAKTLFLQSVLRRDKRVSLFLRSSTGKAQKNIKIGKEIR